MNAQQTVLVVEDEPIIRFAVADTLRDAGYQVFEAANGDEAFHTLETGLLVDLVVTDINMPGTLDGLMLTAHIKTRTPTLPVFVVSSQLPDGIAFLGDYFLAKPCDYTVLTKTIEQFLAKRSS